MAEVDDPDDAGVPRTRSVTREYDDGRIRVLWDATRCIHTAICLRALPSVFDVHARPWVNLAGAEPDAIAAAVRACPTGALRYDGDGVAPEEPEEPTVIEVVPNGPLLVRGRVLLQDAEEYRVALCRCGASQNKPLCDNSHRLIEFRDREE